MITAAMMEPMANPKTTIAMASITIPGIYGLPTRALAL
jgi:hypothetical protein